MESKSYLIITFGSYVRIMLRKSHQKYVRIMLQKSHQKYVRKLRQIYVRKPCKWLPNVIVILISLAGRNIGIYMTDLLTRRRDIANCPLTKQNHLGKSSNKKLRSSNLVNDGTLRSIAGFASALSNVDDDELFLWYG